MTDTATIQKLERLALHVYAGMLTVDSSPESGVYIQVTSPVQDLNGKGTGFGPLTLNYA